MNRNTLKQGLFKARTVTKLWFKNPDYRPAVVVLLAGGIIGLMLVFLIPPTQSPDEPAHFYRAYQISEGHIMAQDVGPSVGGSLPDGVVNLMQTGLNDMPGGNKDSRFGRIEFHKLASIRNTGKTVPVTFSNTAVYSPVTYAPQVVGIWVGRLFHARPLLTFYWARLVGFMFGLAIIVWAICLLPFGRLFFAIIALIPMSIAELAVVSADTTSIAINFLVIALVLRYAFARNPITTRQGISLVAIFVLLGFCKPALFPVALLSPLLLLNKRTDQQRRWMWVVACMLGAILAAAIWNSAISNLAIRGYQADFAGTNYSQQLSFVEHHPLQYARVLYESFATTRYDYVMNGLIGNFGWEDTPIPLVFDVFGFMLLALAAFITAESEKIKMPTWARWLALLAGLGIIAVTATSEYLLSDPVKLPFVQGFQGRYLLPAIPLLGLAIIASGRQSFDKIHSSILGSRLLKGSVALLVLALIIIVFRYYHLPHILPQPPGPLPPS